MPALSSAANSEFTIIPTEKPLLISYCNLFYFVLMSNASIVVVKKTFRYVNAFFYNHIYRNSIFLEHIYEKRYKVQKQGVFIIGS